MAVVNSLARFPSFMGQLSAKTVALTATATNTITGLVTSAGWVRVKVSGGGAANTTVALSVSLTDGTGTVIIGSVAATAVPNVASSGLDMLFPYNIDIIATTLSVTATVAGDATTATLNVEILACV